MNRLTTLTISAALLAGCASGSKEVEAAYVSPGKYADLECEALLTERERVKGEIVKVAEAQDEKAGADAAAMAVAIIVFAPAAAFLAAGEDREDELAQLRGEYEAATRAGSEKGCISAEQLAAEKAEAEAAQAALEEERKRRRAGLSGSPATE